MLTRATGTNAAISLAHAAPFRLGALEVRPATRQLIRDGQSETIEPRVMQVLLALARADGAVVTRDELTELCWDGRIVSESAINRVIARIRRIAADPGGGAFRVETITKVGYRLVGAGIDAPPIDTLPPSAVPPDAPPARPDRRAWLAAGLVAGLAAAGGGLAWRRTARGGGTDTARRLYEKGLAVADGGNPGATEQALAYFREAVRADPDFAPAWGALALAYRDAASWVGNSAAPGQIPRSRAAAARALALQPDNADARLALTLLGPYFRRWKAVEDDVRSILADQPTHRRSRSTLAALLDDVGRSRDSVPILRTLSGADQFSPLARYRYIYALWNVGRIEEAETALEAAAVRWPKHGAIWQARVKFLAYTGRAAAALALIEDPGAYPIDTPMDRARQTATVRAAQTRRAEDVDAAVAAQLAGLAAEPLNAVNAMQYIASFGRLDEAFAIAWGFYAGTGRWAALRWPEKEFSGPQTATLFNPLTAPMRADPRFGSLVRAIGLEEYWRASGSTPDYRL